MKKAIHAIQRDSVPVFRFLSELNTGVIQN